MLNFDAEKSANPFFDYFGLIFGAVWGVWGVAEFKLRLQADFNVSFHTPCTPGRGAADEKCSKTPQTPTATAFYKPIPPDRGHATAAAEAGAGASATVTASTAVAVAAEVANRQRGDAGPDQQAPVTQGTSGTPAKSAARTMWILTKYPNKKKSGFRPTTATQYATQ